MDGMKRVLRMIYAAWKTFGLRRAVTSSWYLLLYLFTWTTLALDRVFFPRYRTIEVTRPLFIIGHPRSGTTFFHRLLNQTDELVTFKLWELIVPSLTGRWLLRPIIEALFALYRQDMADGSSFFDEGSHDTDMDAVEEEELLYYPIYESQFCFAFSPLAFDDKEHPELIYYDQLEPARRKRATRYLRACFQRQIYATGKTRILAKMPYSTMRIRALMEEFPDARFVYLVRSPYETISSHLTLHRSFFAHRWGLETIPEDRLTRYYQRRYQYNVALYRYFHDLQRSGALPPDRVKVIHYDRFREDLETAFEDLVAFTGLEVSDSLRQRVREQAARQKGYARRHTNLELSQFGLSRAQIARDLDFVFREYGFDPGPLVEVGEANVGTDPERSDAMEVTWG